MRMLVCGGRDFGVGMRKYPLDRVEYDALVFEHYGLFYHTLDSYLTDNPHLLLISGGARGADKMAEEYALDRGLNILVFPVTAKDWGCTERVLARCVTSR